MFILFSFDKNQYFTMILISLVCFLALDMHIGICCLIKTFFHILLFYFVLEPLPHQKNYSWQILPYLHTIEIGIWHLNLQPWMWLLTNLFSCVQMFLFKSLLINILLFKKCDLMTKNLSQHIFYSQHVFMAWKQCR